VRLNAGLRGGGGGFVEVFGVGLPWAWARLATKVSSQAARGAGRERDRRVKGLR
jgi:hypothetical protein